MPISDSKGQLNELVDEVTRTAERVVITRDGAPAAVLMSTAEWESIEDTLFWVSQPGILDEIAEVRAEVAAGDFVTLDQIRAEVEERRAK